jgi:methyl-accepting chemotaxis protein
MTPLHMPPAASATGFPAIPDSMRESTPLDSLAGLASELRSGPLTRELMNVLLQKVQGGLAGVTTSSEGVFLLVGERLMDLQLKARELANQTTSISELLSSDEGSPEVLRNLLTAAQRGYQGDDTVVRIQEIQENVKAIHQAIQAIDPIANVFQVLGVTTRIESARFDAGATFVDLAQAVTALSRQIREQIGNISDSAAALLDTTCRAAEEVRSLAQKFRDNLGPLASQTNAELLKIHDRRSQVSQASKRLAERFEGISRAVGDVVTALQSHDIVRQQIEHVLDAFRPLDRLDVSESCVTDIARLQAAQLNNSQTTFETSIEQIRDALVRIELKIGEVADESARLLGQSSNGDAAFSSNIQSDLGGILVILESNVAADRRLSITADAVHERVSEISRTIDEARAIGANMQFIALNATIQAVRLGPDGAALRIVAQTIRELAQDAETRFNTLEDFLNALRDASAALRKGAGARSSWEVEITQLRPCIEAMTFIQESACRDYTRTIELTAWLKQRIQETIAAFGTQKECLGVLAATTELLQQLSAHAEPAGIAGLEPMAAKYTMRSERAVHRATCENVLRKDGSSTPQSPLPVPQDDNVEFF